MSTQKSRVERYADRLGYDFDAQSDGEQKRIRGMLDGCIDSENQEFWALYSALDVSQSEVKDLVAPAVETSQSTVSRAIREKDETVVHDETALDLAGKLHEDDVDTYPEEWLDAYRQVLAEAKADVLALWVISAAEKETPEWAARRFPELVGCHQYRADRFTENVDPVDDSHLNRLESVNTDQWSARGKR